MKFCLPFYLLLFFSIHTFLDCNFVNAAIYKVYANHKNIGDANLFEHNDESVDESLSELIQQEWHEPRVTYSKPHICSAPTRTPEVEESSEDFEFQIENDQLLLPLSTERENFTRHSKEDEAAFTNPPTTEFYYLEHTLEPANFEPSKLKYRSPTYSDPLTLNQLAELIAFDPVTLNFLADLGQLQNIQFYFPYIQLLNGHTFSFHEQHPVQLAENTSHLQDNPCFLYTVCFREVLLQNPKPKKLKYITIGFIDSQVPTVICVAEMTKQYSLPETKMYINQLTFINSDFLLERSQNGVNSGGDIEITTCESKALIVINLITNLLKSMADNNKQRTYSTASTPDIDEMERLQEEMKTLELDQNIEERQNTPPLNVVPNTIKPDSANVTEVPPFPLHSHSRKRHQSCPEHLIKDKKYNKTDTNNEQN